MKIDHGVRHLNRLATLYLIAAMVSFVGPVTVMNIVASFWPDKCNEILRFAMGLPYIGWYGGQHLLLGFLISSLVSCLLMAMHMRCSWKATRRKIAIMQDNQVDLAEQRS